MAAFDPLQPGGELSAPPTGPAGASVDWTKVWPQAPAETKQRLRRLAVQGDGLGVGEREKFPLGLDHLVADLQIIDNISIIYEYRLSFHLSHSRNDMKGKKSLLLSGPAQCGSLLS
jgi:hypothetical protein